ncbi:MAG: hypothetical protein FWF80_05950 [Defluviitaleaceae bacterium]|nr:hypothetical protein [Defluviitaleaceae bacterium]
MTLVANTRKTAVRIASVATAVFDMHFPFGIRMNKDTHVFDASFFENERGEKRCFMAALPIETAEEIAAEGVKTAGSIHRIDRIETAEHLAFRKFCSEYETALIFLPQDDGLRVLHIDDNLPVAAHCISNSPVRRTEEFLLFYNAIENKPKIVLVENEKDLAWVREILPEFPILHINILE